MIIELNKPFVDYQPLELLSGERCSYRQVYKALDCEGTEVFLTVYDKEKLPKCLQGDTIKEFNIVYNMTNEVFPRHIGTGSATYKGRSIPFMSTLFFDFMTLREAVESKVLSEKDSVNIAYHMVIGLKELLYHTKGGGHFNICPDTVLLSKEENGLFKVHIMGMEHASTACNGSPEFDTETLNHCFRAPESFLGRFSPASDVYSMGMLLTYMLQGEYPYDINETMTKDEILSVIKCNQPRVNVPAGLDTIINNALSKKSKERYKDIEGLGVALMLYMGLEKTNNFSCFSNGKKRKIGSNVKGRIGNGCIIEKKEREESSLSSQEPKIDVNISVKEGAGFEAVAGMTELKKKLSRDFIDIVSNKELAKEYDILPPNMLFFGPPGTGKTYISQRLAEQCGLAFCSIKPSDLASIWVHGSQRLLRQLFEQAADLAKKNNRGCLLLIDEFDAVASKRTEEDHNHQAGEVAELLTQLNDCIEKNVYVIGTTNFLNRIDKAVIRKGRVDKVVFIGMPDAECRRQIFELELKKRPHEQDIDIELLSKLTDGYTSSDISYIVKESARSSFEASIQTEEKKAVKISQKILEEIISRTKPSVSPDEVRRYEMIRDEYIRKNGDEKRRIGFLP